MNHPNRFVWGSAAERARLTAIEDVALPGLHPSQVVLTDSNGYRNVFTRIPKFNVEDIDAALGTGIHPAFTVGGVEKDAIYVGSFLASLTGGVARSIPGVDPAVSINFDNAVTACRAMGAGYHLMTNAEWSAVALLAFKQSKMPRGNTDYGRHHTNKFETAVRQDSGAPGDSAGSPSARTLTGTGPEEWAFRGIHDLTGNVWEWQAGARTNDGEIQIIENNNAAADGADLSSTSTEWKAISAAGALVAPGTAGSMKWDASGALGTGAPILSDTITSQSTGSEQANEAFKSLTENLTGDAPDILHQLGIYPFPALSALGGDRVYTRNIGERLPFRGGFWSFGSNSGLFSLNWLYSRGSSDSNLGFRPAFVI